ncbi:LysE family transporter [Brevibacillus centrosporus]|uniref:LysE family transporter n=1 Tax=Brevibacillus centrosporus TaxID=54910 RepID=UPI003D1EDF0D
MTAVWNGLLFGMLLQLSVGPVCLAVLQRSISLGFRQAWWMIVGVAVVDAAYMAGAIGGLALILQIKMVKQLVVIGGAVILIWFGMGSMRAKVTDTGVVQAAASGTADNAPLSMPAAERKEREIGKGRSFLYGVGLTLTNPLTILFWAGVFGSLMSSQTTLAGGQLFGFAVGCVLSTLLFLTGIARLGTYAAKMLHPVWLKRFNLLVGLFLIGFAIVLFFQNHWSF